MRSTRHLILLLLLSLFVGCYNLDDQLTEYEQKIVVDGRIEQGKFAQIYLSKSAPYVGEVDSVSIRNYSLTTAKVTLSNGSISEVLTLKPNQEYFPPYVYTSTTIKGEINKHYDLKVTYSGKVITSTTTIPDAFAIDSVWFELVNTNDSTGIVKALITDPIETTDYYLTSTKVNSESEYHHTYLNLFKDEYFNGDTITFGLMQGGLATNLGNTGVYYHWGDTIYVKISKIDEASYKFWKSFNYEILNTANPFASSNATITSNIEGGVGIWSGYSSDYKILIAK